MRHSQLFRHGLVNAACFLILISAATSLWSQSPPAGKTETLVWEEPLQCVSCHRNRNIQTNEGVLSANRFCLDCHQEQDCGKTRGDKTISLHVPKDVFEDDPHRYQACLSCHTDVARSPHVSERGAQCLQCHPRHGPAEAHDPHLRVSCQACHFASQAVELDPEQSGIDLAGVDEEGKPLSLAGHEWAEAGSEQSCEKCHHPENGVGAPAAVLPAKSLLCLACHDTPVSLGFASGLYWGPLLIMVFGFVVLVSLWLKGSINGQQLSGHHKLVFLGDSLWKSIFSKNILRLGRILLVDVLLQKRILAEGVQRWSIHSLIYLGFVARFSLSVFTLILFSFNPESELALMLINKNSPFVAVAYDLLGLSILIGVCWAAVQRFLIRPPQLLAKEQDIIALLLIGLLVLTGLFLEGARILVSQIPAETAVFSFVGYPIAKVMEVLSPSWQKGFGYLWYVHALLWGLFLVYLPFGKLKHMVTTPLNLMFNPSETEEQR